MERKKMVYIALIAAAFLFTLIFIFRACAPDRPELVKTALIGGEEYDPEKWGEVYPLEYESWLKTKEPRPAGKSKYKRGWDTDKIKYDKLSEFPFMALLFKGWGFGIEYNEPRGHYYMMIDQREIDPSRVKAGGVCLTCKTPYMNKLLKTHGKELLRMPYLEAVARIPEKHRDLGVTCIDCHDNKNLGLKVSRWTVKEGLENLGRAEFSRQEMRLIVCGQCHVTYIIPKDEKMQSMNVIFPWKGSKWGDISIENIIRIIKGDPAHQEWKQEVTGFKVGFIRHPEFEFFTRQSVHFKAGVACADCHMPYQVVGSFKISDHNIMSPLKNDMKACLKCHPHSADRLKEQVITIQDRTASLLGRAGYATAVTARLFELAHREQAAGRIIDKALYDRAKDFYLEAFYRTGYMGAENSIGFHNPSEAGRILGDAVAFASRAEGLLRQALAKAGVYPPENVSLELPRYLNGRGVKRFNFIPNQEFKDPFGIQDALLPRSARGI